MKVWDKIPVEEHDKGLRVLIIANYVREKEGGRADPFHGHFLRTDNLASIIQVYIMANTSSHGIMNIT